MPLGKITDVDKDAKEIEKIQTDLLRLDLACGNNKQEGFIGVDVSESTGADAIANLSEGPMWMLFPKEPSSMEFKRLQPYLDETYCLHDGSVSEIFCSHFIEHVFDIKMFMEECWRVMADKAIIRIIAPYYTSVRATQDFTHIRSISENTFLYFNKKWITDNKLEHYEINCNFNIDSIKYIYYPEWGVRAKQAQEWARQHYWNVVMDIDVILRAIK
jgi:hypothetical protein